MPDGTPNNITPDQSYLIGEVLRNRVQADYDHWEITLVAGQRRQLPGQWAYVALLDVVDGAGAVPATDVVSVSWNSSTFRTLPRGLFVRVPTPVNGWIEVISTINCTIKMVTGIGEIKDSRLIPPAGGVPVVPVAGACFPIELCPGLAALPVVATNKFVEATTWNADEAPNGFLSQFGGFIGASTDIVLFGPLAYPVTLYAGFIGFGDGNGAGFGAEAEANFYCTNGVNYFQVLHNQIATAGGKFEFRNAWMDGSCRVPAGYQVRFYYSKYAGIGGFTARYNISAKG